MGENSIQNKIERKFKIYETYDAFKRDRAAGFIKDELIVFIKQNQVIWTHGQEFKANGDSLLQQITNLNSTLGGRIDNVLTIINGIDTKYASILNQTNIDTSSLDEAKELLQDAKDRLTAAEERIQELLEKGATIDLIILQFEGLVAGLEGIIAGIVTILEWIDLVNGTLGTLITFDDVINRSSTIYEHIFNLIGQLIKQELRVIDTDKDVVDAVGRIMASGLLNDYVRHTDLSNNQYLEALAQRLMKTNGLSSTIRDITSVTKELDGVKTSVGTLIESISTLEGDIEEIKKLTGKDALAGIIFEVLKDDSVAGSIVLALLKDGRVITEITSDETFINSLVTRIEGKLDVKESITIGDVKDCIDDALKLYTTLTEEGIVIRGSDNNKLQLALLKTADNRSSRETGHTEPDTFKGGLRHWIDNNKNEKQGSDRYGDFYEKDTSNFELNVDGSGHLGRLKKFTMPDGLEIYKHPITIDKDGVVTIIGDVIKDATGEDVDWNLEVISYKPEYRFAQIRNELVPSDLSTILPEGTEYAVTYKLNGIDLSCSWVENAMSGQKGYSIFMIIRNNTLKENTVIEYGSWQGPYQISGADGAIGTDSDGIHFIYQKTLDSNTPSISGVTTNNLGRWTESASDAQIDELYRYSWMAFSTEAEKDGSGKIKYWKNFQGPVMWSVWGESGIDGDGIEYIFCVTPDNKNWSDKTERLNPESWDANQEDEYIHPDVKAAKDGDINKWHDDPLKMELGLYQWASVRKYAGKDKKWGKYSKPALWSYYPYDAVVSGYTVNIDNPNIAVSVNSHGFLATEDNKDVNDFVRDIKWNLYKSNSGKVAYVLNLDGYGGNISPENPVYTVDTGTSLESVAGARPQDKKWYDVNIVDDGDGNAYGRLNIVSYYKVKQQNLEAEEDDSVFKYTDATDEKLNLINNNIKATFTYKIYESRDSDPAYTLTKTCYVTGVYRGADGVPGSTLDLKTSSVVVYKDRTTGNLSPKTIDVWCLETIGNSEYNIIFPEDTNSTSTIRFGYWRGPNDPGIQGTTINTPGIQQLTTKTLSTSGDTPIVIYLFANKNGVWYAIDAHTINFVLSGEDGVGTLESTVFCRSSVNLIGGTINAPTGGTYSDPLPNPSGVYYKDKNGTEKPVYEMDLENRAMRNGVQLTQWSDGIPDGVETLWESRCIFSSNSSNTAEWTPPRIVSDRSDYDVEFAYEQPGGETPTSPTSQNRHGSDANQVWFDPDLDESIIRWSDVVWRAERWVLDGMPTRWIITRIKGERGESRFVSTIFTRCNVENGNISAPNRDGGRDNTSTWSDPRPHDDASRVRDKLGNHIGNCYWSDEIPNGKETIWACTGVFEADVQGTVWSDPQQMTDTETYDVEFAKELIGGSKPSEPDESNRHGGSGTQIWFDPDLDPDEDWTEMVWRAERRIKNGEEGPWTILRIKGEQGPSGDGFNLTAGGYEGGILFLDYDNFGRKESGSVVIPIQLHFGTDLVDNSKWNLSAENNQQIAFDVDNSNKTITVNSVLSGSDHKIRILSTIKSEYTDELGNDTQTILIDVRRRINTIYSVDVSPDRITYNTTTGKFTDIDLDLYTVSVRIKKNESERVDSRAWNITNDGNISQLNREYNTNTNSWEYTVSGTNNSITFTAKPNSSTEGEGITGRLIIDKIANGVTPDPHPTYTLIADSASAVYDSQDGLTITFGTIKVVDQDGNEVSGVNIKYRIGGENSEFPIPPDNSINLDRSKMPSCVIFIARKDSKVIGVAYIPVTALPSSIELSEDNLNDIASRVGTTGKMFYTAGEYSNNVEYSTVEDRIPVVYFWEYDLDRGYWWYLAENNNKSDSTYYAPGEHPNNNSEVTDIYGRKFKVGGDYTDSNFINKYWKKADKFNVVIADAVFADFANLGNAIISGDFIFSQHGKIGNKSYVAGENYLSGTLNYPAYLNFHPQLSLTDNINVTIASYSEAEDGKFVADEYNDKYYIKDTGIKIFVGAANLDCVLRITLHTGSNIENSAQFAIGTGTKDGEHTNIDCTVNLASIADKYKNKWCHLYVYSPTINRKAHILSVTLNCLNAFKPNWCVDLKTGKMLAGSGNFIIEPDGTTTIAKGKIVADSDGSITAAGGNFRIDTSGNLTIGGVSAGGTSAGNNITLTSYRYSSSIHNFPGNGDKNATNSNIIIDDINNKLTDVILIRPSIEHTYAEYTDDDSYKIQIPNPDDCVGKQVEIIVAGDMPNNTGTSIMLYCKSGYSNADKESFCIAGIAGNFGEMYDNKIYLKHGNSDITSYPHIKLISIKESNACYWYAIPDFV